MIRLNSGHEMPTLGFGTYPIMDTEPIFNAIKNGYRNIDTAAVYKNEKFVGEAVARA
jgi:diketogulonate reductase-like aldo/keto reductase